jgi:hypothetical protein
MGVKGNALAFARATMLVGEKTRFLERSARMLLKNQSPNRKDIGEELGSRTNLQRELAEQGLQNAYHGGTRHVLDNSSRAPGTENSDRSA